MPAWRAIVTGPLFPVRLHAAALRLATARQRRWIIAELIANGALLALAFPALAKRLDAVAPDLTERRVF